jgi:3-carboxy-cis,cis-muconate cycloisomerase
LPAERELSAGDSLFDPIFTTDELRRATSDGAWMAAMLDFESALALAQADAGLVPASAAQAIVSACTDASFDIGEIGREARSAGNPAAPLVRALVDAAGTAGAGYVHFGATSQDVLDTAAMLVSKRATAIVLGELDRATDACALLVERHGSTVLTARTLLQPAVPTTFGLKAAGWLDGLLDAGEGLREVRESALAVQLGGAGGTLASLGDKGIEVTRLLAHRLGLAEPRLAWHTGRVRIARLASSLAIAAGVAAKIALDVTLLMQAEVAEASEHAGGGSSTLPHKSNPVACASVSGAARRAGALAGLLLQGLAQEHERATGAW